MVGVYKLEITETEADLKPRLRTQKTASDQERIHLLYLLKTEQATTIQAAAARLGRHQVTLQEWIRLYRRGGLEAILEHQPRTGRQQSIPQWAQDALNQRVAFPRDEPDRASVEHLKFGLRGKLLKNLDELRVLMRARLEEISQAVIASIVGWDSILKALSVAGM